MKNLENYGVQELSTKESSEIEGGSIWTFLIAAVFVVAAIFLSNNNDNVNF